MGPWSRSFLAAVVGNAERPDLEVRNLRIEPGVITVEVDGCEVSLSASPIPKRTWESITRFAKGMGALEDAVTGRVQSVHLEHLLEEDWDENLIPRRSAIWHTCSCDAGAACEHVFSLVFAVGEEIDRAPLSLLRWRGLAQDSDSRPHTRTNPWDGADLAQIKETRPMPRYAVLKRLGNEASLPEGLARLRRAYEVISAGSTRRDE